jgi:hypothetical protein
MSRWRHAKKASSMSVKELAGLTGAEPAAVRGMNAAGRSNLVHYVFGTAG